MSQYVSEAKTPPENDLGETRSDYGASEGSRRQEDTRMAGEISQDAAVMSGKPYGQAIDMEISAGQKMLSAVSGSLLTSLLGTSYVLKLTRTCN